MYDGHWCDQVERWTTGHREGALTVWYTVLMFSGPYRSELALFPGPTQLSVTCSTEKQERAWYNLLRE